MVACTDASIGPRPQHTTSPADPNTRTVDHSRGDQLRPKPQRLELDTQCLSGVDR